MCQNILASLQSRLPLDSAGARGSKEKEEEKEEREKKKEREKEKGKEITPEGPAALQRKG